MEKIKQIVWDWNGTLLNDVEMCVRVMNTLLQKSALPTMTCETYKTVFGFPVKDYYQKLGFDFQKIPFEVVGHEFMDRYFEELPDCELFEDVRTVLTRFQQAGIQQLVLSAMEHQSLLESLKDKGIIDFFADVQGIDNHLAAGKTQLAEGLIARSAFEASETLFIGDTIHDQEVAHSVGSRSVLISRGHFSKERLLLSESSVYDSLSKFSSHFFET